MSKISTKVMVQSVSIWQVIVDFRIWRQLIKIVNELAPYFLKLFTIGLGVFCTLFFQQFLGQGNPRLPFSSRFKGLADTRQPTHYVHPDGSTLEGNRSACALQLSHKEICQQLQSFIACHWRLFTTAPRWEKWIDCTQWLWNSSAAD